MVFADAAGASTFVLHPTADARVEVEYPETNFGGSYLRVDGGIDPWVRTYMRFDASGVTGAVAHATLRVYATTDTINGPAVYESEHDWSEAGLTWNTRPSRSTITLDDSGILLADTWVEFDVTALVRAGGSYAFAFLGNSSDGVNFASRESSHPPELVVTVVDGWPANPFPHGSVWNPGAQIPPDHPVDPNSDGYISYWLAHLTTPKLVIGPWAVAVAEASEGAPAYTINVVPDGHGPSTINRLGPVPIPLGTRPDPGGDGHLAIVDYRRGIEWAFWQARYDSLTDTWTTTCGSALYLTEMAAPSSSCGANTGNLPATAGLVTPEEIEAGVIAHPLVFAANHLGSPSGKVYRCPATGSWGISTDPNALVAGMWLQLNPALDVEALPIPAWEKTIARALQGYGAYVRDQTSGGDADFYTENPINRDPDAWQRLGFDYNTLFSAGFPWHEMRVLAPPC